MKADLLAILREAGVRMGLVCANLLIVFAMWSPPKHSMRAAIAAGGVGFITMLAISGGKWLAEQDRP